MNVTDAGVLRPGVRARRLLVVHNPTAGARRAARVDRFVALLRAAGARVEIAVTERAGDAERIARAASVGGCDAVVVAGGDGTINEALNGLDLEAGTLGIIPCGTANVLARELRLPSDPRALAALLATGPTRSVQPGLGNGRRFAMMVGVGLDARAVATVSPRLKRAVGRYAYAASILGAIAAAPGAARFTVTFEGRQRPAAWVVAARGRHYAGDFVVAPGADLGRADVEVCLCPHGGRLNALRYIASLGLGMLGANPDVRRATATSVRIDGPPDEPVQADGEIIGHLPVVITVAPQRLRVIAPPS